MKISPYKLILRLS